MWKKSKKNTKTKSDSKTVCRLHSNCVIQLILGAKEKHVERK